MFGLAPFVAILTRALGRSAFAIALAGAVMAALVGTIHGVRVLMAERDIAQASANAANIKREALALELSHARDEARLAGQLAAQEAARVAELTPRVESLLQELNRAKTSVPKGCEHVLDPLRTAVRGLRELRSGAASGTGNDASAGALAVR